MFGFYYHRRPHILTQDFNVTSCFLHLKRNEEKKREKSIEHEFDQENNKSFVFSSAASKGRMKELQAEFDTHFTGGEGHENKREGEKKNQFFPHFAPDVY